MTSPDGGHPGRPVVRSAACPAPPHWGYLTHWHWGTSPGCPDSQLHPQERGRGTPLSSGAPRRCISQWLTSHFHTQQCPLQNRGQDLQLLLIILMFKSRVILICSVWCLSSYHADKKGLLFLKNIHSIWAKRWPSRPLATPSLCSPRQTTTNGKFVDCIFSSKKDETSQDHGERTLAG